MRASRRRGFRALATLVALTAPGTAAAQDPLGWTVVWENDLFVPRALSSDESYTNGVRVALGRDWDRARRFGDALRLRHPLARSDLFHSTSAAFVFGQNFFTPGVINAFDPDPRDRPFAGLLYVGGRVEITEDPPGDVRAFLVQLQHAVELDVGVMGPPALAGPTQAGVHVPVESKIPKGWDHQLGTEPAVAVSTMSRARVGWHFLDVVPHGGLMLGTPQTYAFGGLTARAGWNMTGFPALLIRQTAVPAADRPEREVSFLAAVEGRAFARNGFVDGSLLGGAPSVPRESGVGELQYGASLRLADWRGSYTLVRRSPEVRGDGPAGGRYHNFGSFTVAYEPGMRTAADREGTLTGRLGAGYAIPVGRSVSVGLDTAWSRLGVESPDGPSARFVATTLAVHWHP